MRMAFLHGLQSAAPGTHWRHSLRPTCGFSYRRDHFPRKPDKLIRVAYLPIDHSDRPVLAAAREEVQQQTTARHIALAKQAERKALQEHAL